MAIRPEINDHVEFDGFGKMDDAPVPPMPWTGKVTGVTDYGYSIKRDHDGKTQMVAKRDVLAYVGKKRK